MFQIIHENFEEHRALMNRFRKKDFYSIECGMLWKWLEILISDHTNRRESDIDRHKISKKNSAKSTPKIRRSVYCMKNLSKGNGMVPMEARDTKIIRRIVSAAKNTPETDLYLRIFTMTSIQIDQTRILGKDHLTAAITKIRQAVQISTRAYARDRPHTEGAWISLGARWRMNRVYSALVGSMWIPTSRVHELSNFSATPPSGG